MVHIGCSHFIFRTFPSLAEYHIYIYLSLLLWVIHSLTDPHISKYLGLLL